MTAVGGLRRFVRPAGSPAAVTTCELCAGRVDDEHRHVVDVARRRLLCACRPCALLFTEPGAGRGNYRTVPDRYTATALDEQQWDRLQVPVAMAFFFVNSALGRVVAQYPSPAGATESLLDLSAWKSIAAADPVVASLEPDVEGFVVRRHRGGGFEAYVVPITDCYELVGRLRLHWRGFDGGAEARRDIEEFFTRARERSPRA